MEPNDFPEDEPARVDAGNADWRSLKHLRDRVDAAVREIERLRAENAALAKRLIELEERAQDGSSFSFSDDEGSEELKARVQGFIRIVDGLLASGDGANGTPEDAP
ncbi:MAG: hypothetical protein AAGK21_03775 [Bacteroidota bacterium]